MIRDLDALVPGGQPPWLALVDSLRRSFAAPRILPVDAEQARASLRQLQVTADSALGAISLNCGGILLYDGWLRVFGGSSCQQVNLPSIAQVNAFPADVDSTWAPTQGLIVAHDVLGGVFALNGLRPCPERPGVPGEMIYFSPRSLDWTRMEMSHHEWLAWCVSGELPRFYGDLLWPQWQDDVRAIRADQGIAVFPFLWSDEEEAARHDITRIVAPMAEILDGHLRAAAGIGRHMHGGLGNYPTDQPVKG